MKLEDMPGVMKIDLSEVSCPFSNCESYGRVLPCYLSHKHTDCDEFKRLYDLTIPPTLTSIRDHQNP